MIPSLKSLLFTEQTEAPPPSENNIVEDIERMKDALKDAVASSNEFYHMEFVKPDPRIRRPLPAPPKDKKTRLEMRSTTMLIFRDETMTLNLYIKETQTGYRLSASLGATDMFKASTSDHREFELEVASADEAVEHGARDLIAGLEHKRTMREAVRPQLLDVINFVIPTLVSMGVSESRINDKDGDNIVFNGPSAAGEYNARKSFWYGNISIMIEVRKNAQKTKTAWLVQLSAEFGEDGMGEVPPFSPEIWPSGAYVNISDDTPDDTYELKKKLYTELEKLADFLKDVRP